MYLYVKLNWDANFFFPVESKDCMNSASYEWKYVKEINSFIWIFLWNAKTNEIERNVVMLNKKRRYLDMIDVEVKNK